MISNIGVSVSPWMRKHRSLDHVDVTFDSDYFYMFTTFDREVGCDVWLGQKTLKSGLRRYWVRFQLNSAIVNKCIDTSKMSDNGIIPKVVFAGHFDYKKDWPYVRGEFDGGFEELKKVLAKVEKKPSKIWKGLFKEIFS